MSKPKPINVALDPDLHEQLKVLAARRRMPLYVLVRMALVGFLTQQES